MTQRLHSQFSPFGVAVLLASLVIGVAFPSSAEARTRSFCGGVVKRSCGGHLQPACTSGAACDAGFSSYSGKPFPITIDCPWPIADSKVSTGCYDQRPDCGECSASGQIPCPVEAEPWCTAGCDAGLEPDPIFGLCQVPGSFEPPTAGANESCVPGAIDCEDGLQCTLALVCSHEPAHEGETCDVTAPCSDGLYCQAGVPQVCRRMRTVGEGCSAFNPCADGLSCEACFTERCNAPFQCFPNANDGAITEQQCRTLYSPVIADGITGGDVAFTWAGGNGIGAVATESQAFGVAYGQNGEFGCYTALCGGIFSDVGITGAFTSLGLYTEFDAVGGTSFVNTQNAQTPFKLLNFSTSQIFERFGDEFPPLTGDLIGTEDALGVGGGLNPSPFTAGSFYCETILDRVIVDPNENRPPPLALPPLEQIVNPDFETDLFGWTCTNGGTCSWSWDSPLAATGSGRVTSPPDGELSTTGRLESSCVRVQEGVPYRGVVWARTTGGEAGSAYLLWSSSDACVGGVVGVDTIGVSPADGTWRLLSTLVDAPLGAHTVRLVADATRNATTSASSTTTIDAAYLPEARGLAASLAAIAALVALARGGRLGRKAGMMEAGEDAGLRRSRGVPRRPAPRGAGDR